MTRHELKLDAKYFDDVKSGKKNFEIRNNDRGYQVGDVLELKAFKNSSYVKLLDDWSRKDLLIGWCPVPAEVADTITVKVNRIFDLYYISPFLSDEYVMWRKHQKNLSNYKHLVFGETASDNSAIHFAKVRGVVKELFGNAPLPEDYVVLGIEVI